METKKEKARYMFFQLLRHILEDRPTVAARLRCHCCCNAGSQLKCSLFSAYILSAESTIKGLEDLGRWHVDWPVGPWVCHFEWQCFEMTNK